MGEERILDLEKYRKIINHQFDLEILCKWREIKVIEEELERGKNLLSYLEKLVLNEYIYGKDVDRPMSAGPVTTSSRIQTPVPFASPTKRTSRYSTPLSATKDSQLPQYQYDVKADGTIVRLVCPKCGADKFRSLLGFLNHCRINCHLTFMSQEEKLMKCGMPVDPSEVPPDYFQKHPTQIKQELDLAQLRAEIQGPVIAHTKRPRIRLFNEEIDIVGENQSHPHQLVPVEMEGLDEPIQVIPTSLAGHHDNVEDLDSRYYIRKRIVIGNQAKMLHDHKPDPSQPSHQWKIYVRAFSGGDLSTFVRSVTFVLHPSYKPHDVCVVEGAPFELVRLGWGEFPVRVQIHFIDQRNRPIEFVHHLRLNSTRAPRLSSVSEQTFDLDLDRATVFVDSQPPTNAPFIQAADFLAIASRSFPLFGIGPQTISYRRVASLPQFLALSYDEKCALEVERAQALHAFVTDRHQCQLTVEQVVLWCRENGLTPKIEADHEVEQFDPDDAISSSEDQLDRNVALAEIMALKYCRYCGLAHFPQDRFEVLQKNCSLKPRKLHLSSRTAASELLSRYELKPKEGNQSTVNKTRDEEPYPYSYDTSTWPLDQQWIHSHIDELELSHYPPNQQETIIAITQAFKTFLKDLIDRSVSRIPKSIERDVGRPVLLTPVYLYMTLTGGAENPEDQIFDFITNSHMTG